VPGATTDLNLIRHLLAMEMNEANVPLTPYLVKKHKKSSKGRLVLRVNPRWLKEVKILSIYNFFHLLQFGER